MPAGVLQVQGPVEGCYNAILVSELGWVRIHSGLVSVRFLPKWMLVSMSSYTQINPLDLVSKNHRMI